MSQDPFQEREAEKYANPIPSREFILEHLTKREKPASRDELAIELNIEGEEQTEALRRRLRAMERDGQLVFTRRQCYALPERLDLLKGTVIGHRDGYGFLRVEGRKDDLYLSSEQMKPVFTATRCWLSRWARTVRAAAKRASSASSCRKPAR
ncbi:3'-to-5' exoribonuclease RNase R [Klebsiella pneumoniae]|nr:3'-to-5' exoribonuclease RNase R [Klebsiella pneumoniae]